MTTDFRALCAELTEFVARLTKHYYEPAELLNRARAALADEPAVLDGREPVSVTGQPSDGELNRLLWHEFTTSTGHGERTDPIAFARAVLARWGNPAPQPVPVSERLPGPEDCTPHPRTKRGNWCWGFERCEVSLARPARWRLMHMETVEMEASHWLPAHALPLPGQEVEG